MLLTVANGGIKKSDRPTSFLFPTDDIDTNERVGELFNLALGGASSEAPLTSRDEPNNFKGGTTSRKGDVARKLLTTHRKLIKEITKLSKEFTNCVTLEQFNHSAFRFDDLQKSFCEFRCDLKLVLDPEDLNRLSDRITSLYDKCYHLYDQCKLQFSNEMYKENYEDKGTIQPSDSVSQVTEHTRSSTSKTIERQIELDKKRAELHAAFELAEAREAKAKAERAETFAKLRLEEAKLEAEQKRLDCPERDSSVATSRKLGLSLRRGSESSKMPASKAELKKRLRIPTKLGKLLPQTKNPDKTRKVTENTARTKRWIDGLTNPNDQKMNYDNVEETLPKTVFTTTKSLIADHENVAVHQYLERQGRNEFINLASQIAYNGNNLAFVFYENQIRKLMNELPH